MLVLLMCTRTFVVLFEGGFERYDSDCQIRGVRFSRDIESRRLMDFEKQAVFSIVACYMVAYYIWHTSDALDRKRTKSSMKQTNKLTLLFWWADAWS